MYKTLWGCLFFFIAFQVSAATIVYDIGDNNLHFSIQFEQGYSNVDAVRNNRDVVISFDTTEEVTFPRRDFFDAPIRSVWLTSEGTRKQLTFRFEDKVFEPVLTRQAKAINIEFVMPMASSSPALPASAAPVPIKGAYLDMFVGLGIVVAIILLLYGVLKYFFRHTVVTDIPGIGRLLGKIDLEMKKSIVFYELGDVIYMIGVTDGAVNLVDKVTDPVAVNMIKSGFSRRKDFSSYMKFFRKKNEIADDFKDSSALIEEKLSSLRKK